MADNTHPQVHRDGSLECLCRTHADGILSRPQSVGWQANVRFSNSIQMGIVHSGVGKDALIRGEDVPAGMQSHVVTAELALHAPNERCKAL